MKLSKNSLDFYSNKLGKQEMKRYYAGDNLPEVVVSSSYSKVYGTNYYSWLFLNPTSGYGNGVGSVEIPQQDGGLGGGGFTTPLSGQSANFENFLNALGLGASVNGATWDLFSKLMTEGKILSNLALHSSILGVALNVNEISGRFNSGGWDALTNNERIILSFAFIGTIGIIVSAGASFGIIGAGTAAAFGTVGLGADFLGIAFDIWRLSNPGQQLIN